MFLRYAFLADAVTIDSSGKVTAVGIFDRIFAAQFPSLHRDMTIVAFFEGASHEQGEHKATFELRDDKANQLGIMTVGINLDQPGVANGSVRVGVVGKLQDIPFRNSGPYEFVIFVDERFMGRIPFLVQQLRVEKKGEA